jgi:hypothetical protein
LYQVGGGVSEVTGEAFCWYVVFTLAGQVNIYVKDNATLFIVFMALGEIGNQIH